MKKNEKYTDFQEALNAFERTGLAYLLFEMQNVFSVELMHFDQEGDDMLLKKQAFRYYEFDRFVSEDTEAYENLFKKIDKMYIEALLITVRHHFHPEIAAVVPNLKIERRAKGPILLSWAVEGAAIIRAITVVFVDEGERKNPAFLEIIRKMQEEYLSVHRLCKSNPPLPTDKLFDPNVSFSSFSSFDSR